MEHLIVSEISRHGYLAVFVLMVLESACIPIPSEGIMLFGGALASRATIAGTVSHLSVLAVALLGTVGNVVGALIAYWVGLTGGRALVGKWGKYVLIRHHDLDKAETFFDIHGDVAVLISRFLPVVRTFISFPAGVAEMPAVKFAAYTLIGSLPWTFAWAYAGKALANNWQNVSKFGTPISVVFALILIGIVVRWFLERRNSQHLTRDSSR